MIRAVLMMGHSMTMGQESGFPMEMGLVTRRTGSSLPSYLAVCSRTVAAAATELAAETAVAATVVTTGRGTHFVHVPDSGRPLLAADPQSPDHGRLHMAADPKKAKRSRVMTMLMMMRMMERTRRRT